MKYYQINIKMKPNRIILLLCFIAFSLNLMASEMIKITWSVVYYPYGNYYYKNITISATVNKTFTVDWGDGSNIETKTGTGVKQVIGHTYSDTKDYIATITSSSADCLFTYLDCANKVVKNLDVCSLIHLVELDCEGNQISNLDVSNSLVLTKLNCQGNKIGILDVSKNTALTFLNCYSNQISGLDVSNNTDLSILYCGDNQLSNLELTTNTKLTYLDCFNNKLKSLILDSNIVLEHLEISRNQLSTLVLGKKKALTYLYCWGNQLESLDLSETPALEYLSCNYNKLSILDLSKNTALIALHCCENKLNNLDVSKSTKLREIECRRNELYNLDLSTQPLLFTIECGYNKLSSMLLNANAPLDRAVTCEYNGLKLSDLFSISKMIGNGAYRTLTPQHLATETIEVGYPVDFTSQSIFNSIATTFTVLKDGWPAASSDYSMNGKVITFKKDGNFGVMMENKAILSQWAEPVLVFAYFAVGNVGIADIEGRPNVLVFPNPTTDKVYIKTETEMIPEVKLYSINGKLLQHFRSAEIDMSSYLSGVYLLQVHEKRVRIVKN
jgi:hypothetical protein